MQALIFPEGWRIHPCHPNSKKPILDDWPTLASDDPAQHAAWASEYPGCNWAVAVGPSGLAVVDIDGQEGEDNFTLYEIENDLPATREHRTPGGGRHLIFRDEFLTVQNSVGKLGKKIDTRGQNGYIVIPPSTIDGVPYEVIAQRSIADVPDHVARIAGQRREAVGAAGNVGLDDPSAVGRAGRLLHDYVHRGHIAREGEGGDDRTYQVCAEVLNFGLSTDKALELIETIWNCHCVPPWDSEDLRVKIENASRYAQNEAGAWAVPPAHERIEADVLDRLIASAPSVLAAPTPSRFAWMAEAEFKAMPEPTWLIEEMLPERGLSMLYGPSGHFKSFIALNIAAEVAAHGKCVFYVAGEGISRMARLDYPAWKTLHGEERDLPFYMQEDMPLYMDFDASDYIAFAESIKAKAAGRPVGLIVLDTTNRAMLGLDENSAKDVAKFMRAVEVLKQGFNCNVMLIHHTPDADASKARGSSAIYGALDTVLRVDADKEARLVKLWVAKQKNAEERARPFCFRGEKIGGALAFTQIENSALRAEEERAELFDLKAVFGALTKMGAHSPGVTSRALVVELTPRRPEDTEEAYNGMLAERLRTLSAVVKKGRLDGLHEGRGQAIRWMLPE